MVGHSTVGVKHFLLTDATPVGDPSQRHLDLVVVHLGVLPERLVVCGLEVAVQLALVPRLEEAGAVAAAIRALVNPSTKLFFPLGDWIATVLLCHHVLEMG